MTLRAPPGPRARGCPRLAPLTAAADDTPPPQVRSVHTACLVAPARPRVLVALHGVGGNGELFAANFVEAADRNNWLIVAPTLGYGDWQDPQQVARKSRCSSNGWRRISTVRPGRNPSLQRVLLLGHSRGAQLAHRFALFYPDRVLGVAALSAGTYTLPRMLDFPFGMRIRRPARSAGAAVQFLLGVGTDDTNPSEVPRAWDPYLGMTRVQRREHLQLRRARRGATHRPGRLSRRAPRHDARDGAQRRLPARPGPRHTEPRRPRAVQPHPRAQLLVAIPPILSLTGLDQ